MRTRRRRMLWVVVVALAAVSGCGQSQPVAVSGTDGTTTAAAEAAPAEPAVDLEDAGAIVEALAAAGLPVTVVKVYTEADDPNELLGRPGGYIAKSAFADSRVPADKTEGTDPDAVERGGSIEVYPDNASARKRGQYIQTVTQEMQGWAGREYDYVAGQVLLRVTASITPTDAKEYQATLAQLVGEDAVAVDAVDLHSPS